MTADGALSPEELEFEEANELPPREAMTLIEPALELVGGSIIPPVGPGLVDPSPVDPPPLDPPPLDLSQLDPSQLDPSQLDPAAVTSAPPDPSLIAQPAPGNLPPTILA